MITSIILIILGLALLAKHQIKLLRYYYKRAEICPEKIFATGPQSYRLTKLAKEYPQRPTTFIPLVACWTKRPLFSEIAGTLIIFGSLHWAWNYSTDFPLLLSIALGGVSWIFVTKFLLTILLKLCDYPSVKLVVIAMMTYPALIGVFYCLFVLMDYFHIYRFPFKS